MNKLKHGNGATCKIGLKIMASHLWCLNSEMTTFAILLLLLLDKEKQDLLFSVAELQTSQVYSKQLDV